MPTSENHEDIEKDRLKRSVNMAIELGTSKKLSPFEVLMGFQPEMPVEKLLFPTRKTWIGWEAETHFSQLVLHLREQRGRHAKNLVKIADADIERAIKDPKRYAESKVFYSRQKKKESSNTRLRRTRRRLLYHRTIIQKRGHDLVLERWTLYNGVIDGVDLTHTHSPVLCHVAVVRRVFRASR